MTSAQACQERWKRPVGVAEAVLEAGGIGGVPRDGGEGATGGRGGG